MDDLNPPKYEGGSLEDIEFWIMKMEVFFNTDWDVMLIVKEPFEAPRDKKGKKIRPRHLTEKQATRSKANEKVISILINLLSNDVMRCVGEYENAHELWSKIKMVLREPKPTPVEEMSKEEDIVAQVEGEQPEVESHSTSEDKMDEEMPSTSVDEEMSSPVEEGAKIDEVILEEVNRASTSTEARSKKDHIICFGCNEKGHYRSRCPKGKKKVNSKPGKVLSSSNMNCRNEQIQKRKMRIRCFTCGELGHYHTKCPKKRDLEKLAHLKKWEKKKKSSHQGGAPRVRKVYPNLNCNSNMSSFMHARNSD
ncbi:hypothetical protein NP006_23550, partial [Salmonella enterica]|nr:hypothetical protein [Salmonella enterica]